MTELKLTYEGKTKLIFYENVTLEEFYNTIRGEFQIQGSIILMDDEDAQITNTKSFFHGRKLKIREVQVPILSSAVQNNPGIQVSLNGTQRSIEIHLNEIISKEYSCEKEPLTNEINEWAHEKGFNMISSGGEKQLSNGGNFRTLICSNRDCGFKLTFKTQESENEEKTIYKLDLKLALKNNKHSMSFLSRFYLNTPV